MAPNSLWTERIVSGIDLQSRNTGSNQSFKLINQWIHECHGTHAKCNRQPATINESDKRWSPTRLLDVLSLANDPEGPVHLVPCSQLPESVDYVTLSYCWGKDPSFVKLLSTNLPALQTGIPLIQLPRTFRDAVRVTRRLGYQYLWIDALCIIQDSPQDWLQEALLMTKVYASSVLNIAAAASRDANGGLFRDREPESLSGCDIPIAWENMDSYKDSNPVKTQIYHVSVNDPWSNMLFHSPLQTRGWAFQERLLSPRIVYFACDQIYWECCDHCASELYPEEDIFQINDIHYGRRRPSKKILLTSGLMEI